MQSLKLRLREILSQRSKFPKDRAGHGSIGRAKLLSRLHYTVLRCMMLQRTCIKAVYLTWSLTLTAVQRLGLGHLALTWRPFFQRI